ncbi:MAG: amino acid ABC transporter ATP-binding protein [Methylobacteriaceae bacterium]|nr:amino acid ABC transporter ATP-binding protein [Methylobacteriaceae bacterium]MBV9633078.1 amino acid ABC transporter ATP-binding protein [Methylobacteriaceae bacterium]MBV9702737.1 amino acid ABC transporter ATP-binding protein [Methylobacteriaceae bacterium]
MDRPAEARQGGAVDAAQPLLRARNVHKSYGRVEVLRGIDLDIAAGEVVAIIGSSGSGKTTFLRCVNVLEEYEQGTIEVAGQAIGYQDTGRGRVRLPERTVVAQRARIGIVFQGYNLFPHLTARSNVMLGLRKVRGKSTTEAGDIADRWLERVGLADRKSHYPYQLSGGQQQRVAIARAVAMEPKLMLFDEVTSALDPELVGEVLGVMQDLAGSGMTMLVVSHEMLFVGSVANRVVFMDGGRIAEQGPPTTLFRNPTSERLRSFLGRFHGVFR